MHGDASVTHIRQVAALLGYGNFRGGYKGIIKNDNLGRGRSRSRERQYLGNFRRNERKSSRSRSGLRASTNRDRI